MAGPRPTHFRLVDTVALAALASTSLRDELFSEVSMTVTRCCFQELMRGRDDADDWNYRKGCEEAINKSTSTKEITSACSLPVRTARTDSDTYEIT